MGWISEWMAQGKPPERRRKPAKPGNDLHSMLGIDNSDIQALAHTVDPLSAMQESKARPGQSARMLIGEQAANLGVTMPDTSMLVLGPPRTSGKTAAFMIPVMLTHRGPAVSISTKPDVAIASSLVRRRSGKVWQFSPDGSPLIQGMKQVRWSPISADWAGCLARSDWMVKAANMTGDKAGSSSSFFGPRSADLLAAVLYDAGVNDLGMSWVVDMITGARDVELKNVARDLETMHPRAAAVLGGVVTGNPKTMFDIFATASVVLRPYLLPGALATTEDPNFDVDEFVIGKPDERNIFVADTVFNNDMIVDVGDQRTVHELGFKAWLRQKGVYDTVYISVNRENMALVAPLIIGFLGDIRRARGKVADREALAGVPRSPSVLWAIDEMASVPIPDLPEVLRDSGSNGLLILGALQTLKQTAIWGDQGKGLETLFNYVVALPGIREKDTLEALSLLTGDFDRPVWGGGYSNGQYGTKEWHDNLSWQRERRLPPDLIYSGRTDSPDSALVFTPRGWTWVTLQFYFRSNIWPAMISFSTRWSVRASDEWYDPLPLPDLSRGGDYSHIAAISPNTAEDWWHIQGDYIKRLEQWVEDHG